MSGFGVAAAPFAPVILDVVLCAALLLYGVQGYHRGAWRTLALAVGFVVGGLAGILAVPGLVGPHLGALPKPAAALVLGVLILLVAVLGQASALALGRLLRLDRRRGPGPLGRVLGAALTVTLALTVAWLAAGAARVSFPGPVARVIGGSRVLAAADAVAPWSSVQAVDRVRAVFDGLDFPRVFDGLAGEPITPVDPADPQAARGAAITRAVQSVLRVDASATACGRLQEGSGFVAAPGTVVTNAHVVAGASSVRVAVRGRSAPARVVHFDPARDLAVLDVDLRRLGDPAPLPRGADVGQGESVVVAGYPLGGPLRVEPARVRSRVPARGRDIYADRPVTRDVYALRASIQPGNSGGPVVTASGAVVGVVFARSLDDAGTAYALTRTELDRALRAVPSSRAEVGTGRCAAA